jgi:formate hydrogenlyase transcriptional activator
MSSELSHSRTAKLLPFSHPEALNDPEKLLAAYFSSSTVGLCILDTDLRYLAINETLAAINGRPISEHLGRTVREVLGDFADLLEPEFHNALSTREPANFEVAARLPAKTQSGDWIVHFLPIANETGVVTRVGVVVVDITAQKKLEQSLYDMSGKLRHEMSRMQMLLDVSSIMAANWNLQQSFPRISARIRRVFHQEYADVALRDASSGLLIRQAQDFPLGKGLLSSVPVSTSNSPAGQCLEEREPQIFSREQIQAFDSEIAQKLLAEGLQSFCCIPLLRPQGVLGVLALGSTRTEAFHAEDLSLLNQVAAQFAVALENHRAAAEIEALKERLSEERKHLEGDVRSSVEFDEIVGQSAPLRQVLDQVRTVAGSEATVLILGETGTGKELIARAIHRLSTRRESGFIKVNCAAIPTGLLESELFGHEKGAFTGAISQKIGRIELADGGTLFLDEIGEIPLELQPKLLRVLQDQEFERLGSNRTIKVDVRLVAATNRDLTTEVAERHFRSDLFYRLNVFPIRLPALHERPEDIPLLVRYFVRKFSVRMNRHIETIPSGTITALSEWHWPGNIRELENLMERSVILSEGSALRVPLAELHTRLPRVSAQPDHTLDSAEREHIIRVLHETGGVLSGPDGAAHRLGLKRTTLQSKMQRLKITRHDYSNLKQT